ncbi:MAG: Fe-S cluster assembly protein SufD [Chitinophagales bacterium]|nr:Fe-S cluster assembly protein SufD [Chitinophagales bacterium]
MTTIIDTSIYSEAFDNVLNQKALSEGILQKKQKALQQFEQLGIPNMKNEEWKNTYLAKYLKKGFQPGLVKKDLSKTETIAEILPSLTENINRIVIIDGLFSQELSQIHPSIQYNIFSTSHCWSEDIQNANQIFSSLTDEKKQSLTSLNTALSQDGVFIEVVEGGSAHVELLIVQTGSDIISMPRNIIQVGKNAYLNIAEQHILIEGHSMTNMVAEIVMEENAKIEWVKIQDAGDQYHLIDSSYVSQKENSRYHCTTLSLTGDLLRNQQYIQIAGEQAHADLGGIYILENQQQADNIIVIEHQVPNTTSNQLYKGILDGSSTGVFNGKIIVVEDAQKTDAYQSNKNILLSDDAAVFTRPQLEIYADDVKCSHGATSSQIEDYESFYLRSRGIGKELSKALLMFAFVADVVEEIENTTLKEWVKSRISTKLKIDL